MSAGYASARIHEIPTVPDGPGPADWKPVRHHFGIEAFGINAWVATEDGQVLIEEHDELDEPGTVGHEEIYVITVGRATFTIDGEEVARAGGHAGCGARPRAHALRRGGGGRHHRGGGGRVAGRDVHGLAVGGTAARGLTTNLEGARAFTLNAYPCNGG